ncbi:MAG: hypothetical protein LC808_13180 [Actinobacteria bacterium]|nr:hypothetical protein [Actinomycetota bacterium]
MSMMTTSGQAAATTPKSLLDLTGVGYWYWLVDLDDRSCYGECVSLR